jgi:hypothetical protein
VLVKSSVKSIFINYSFSNFELAMQILDQPLIQTNQNDVKYAGFWSRLGALLIDGIILAPLSFGISYFNIVSWKSLLVLILLGLITVTYKPVLEFLYGATWGKMALKLKVVSLQFENATLENSEKPD